MTKRSPELTSLGEVIDPDSDDVFDVLARESAANRLAHEDYMRKRRPTVLERVFTWFYDRSTRQQSAGHNGSSVG
jgi:hypothetical protein